jgi:WD40 repeat protein
LNAERELLFGVLAVQLGLADAGKVMEAAAAWAAKRDRGIGARLVAEEAISQSRCDMIARMVEDAIEANDGDAKKTLADFGGHQSVLSSFGGSVVLGQDGQPEFLAAGSEEVAEASASDAEDAWKVTVEHPGRYRPAGSPSDSRAGRDSAELGRGGIGRVLVAVDEHLGREVAIKELLPQRAPVATPETPVKQASAMMARFLREARVTGQLEHPNIVPVYELGRRRDGTLYYTMKVVRGQTLGDALDACHTLDDRLKLLGHFTDLCQAIAYAHSRGVIHRDIKPQNVMVGEFGETVVLDWGLAKVKGQKDIRAGEIEREIRDIKDSDAGHTVAGTVIGTPSYMSPEQAEGLVDEIDERSDVWALGCVLYEMLTGEPPFVGVTVYDVIGKIIADPVEPVSAQCEEAPPELSSVAEKALSKTKEGRYGSAKTLAADLEAFSAGRRIAAHVYGGWDLIRRFVSRHKAAVVVGAVAVVVLLCIGILSYHGVAEERDRAVNAESRALVERDRAKEAEIQARESERSARENLAVALAEKAARTPSVHHAMLLAARAVELSKNPKALGLLAGLYRDFRPKLKWQSPRGAYCNDLEFWPDNRGFVCLDEMNRKIRTWSLDTGQEEAAFDEFDSALVDLSFSSEGRWFAALDERGTVHLVDWDNRGHNEKLDFATRMPVAIALSANGEKLFLVDESANLEAVDVSSRAVESSQKAPCDTPVAFAAQHDAARIAIGCKDGSVVVWNTQSGKSAHKVATLPAAPDSIAIFSKARQMAIGTGKEVLIGDLAWTRTPRTVLAAGEKVHALQYSPDGRLLAVGVRNKPVVVLAVEAGFRRQVTQSSLKDIRSLAFSSDQQLLVNSRDGRLDLVATEDFEVTGRLRGIFGFVHDVEFSSDGGWLAVGTSSRQLGLVDASTGLIRSTFVPVRKLDFTSILGISISPHKPSVAAGTGEGTVELIDVEKGESLWTAAPGEGKIFDVAFSPDGQSIYSVSSTPGVVRRWSAQSGESLARSEERRFRRGLSVTADGGLIVIGGAHVEILDAETLKLIRRIDGSGSCSAVAFSPDGLRIAVGCGDGSVRVVDAGTGDNLISTLGHSARVGSIAFSPNGDIFASAAGDNTVRVWSSRKGRQVASLSHSHIIRHLAFSKDGRLLAIGGLGSLLRVYEIGNHRRPLWREPARSAIKSISFRLNDNNLIGVTAGGELRCWDLRSGRESPGCEPGAGKERYVLLSGDGDSVLAKGGSGSFSVYNLAGRQLAGPFREEGGTILGTSRNLDFVVARTKDLLISCWSLREGMRKVFESNFSLPPLAAAVTNDGKWLVHAGNDPNIKVFELESGKQVGSLKGHHSWVKTLKFSSDGALLASGDVAGRIILWNPQAGKRILELTHSNQNWVTGLEFSRDGRLLATGSATGEVNVWDLDSRRLLASLPGTTGVSSARFSKDSKLLATAQADGSVRIWDLAVVSQSEADLIEMIWQESGLVLDGIEAVVDPSLFRCSFRLADKAAAL